MEISPVNVEGSGIFVEGSGSRTINDDSGFGSEGVLMEAGPKSPEREVYRQAPE
ncbi:MAG: hypothetical protein METHP_01831 [Methanoregula sp. SKADARSKE-2]|nr:MAG: hypothetical protein METHP_01831 [Methanoregula sp. SKADARSKE-2]